MVCAPGYLSLVGETLWDMNMIESLLVASEFYFITCTIFSEVYLTILRTEGISRNLCNSLFIDPITNTPRKKQPFSLSVNQEVYFDSFQKNSL